jgi:hypothetical protein
MNKARHPDVELAALPPVPDVVHLEDSRRNRLPARGITITNAFSGASSLGSGDPVRPGCPRNRQAVD